MKLALTNEADRLNIKMQIVECSKNPEFLYMGFGEYPDEVNANAFMKHSFGCRVESGSRLLENLRSFKRDLKKAEALIVRK